MKNKIIWIIRKQMFMIAVIFEIFIVLKPIQVIKEQY